MRRHVPSTISIGRIGLPILLTAALSACIGIRPTPYTPSGSLPGELRGRVSIACWGGVEAAASLVDGEDAGGALDDAIRSCASRDEWDLATSRFPAVLRGATAADVLRDRCARLRGLASTPLCQAQ
jgi:hypothetical protein